MSLSLRLYGNIFGEDNVIEQLMTLGGWFPAQRLELAEAFQAFTRTAAYAGYAEDRIGSLERGKYADFVLIDRDIFAGATVDDIRRTKVVETWVAGVRVWPN